MSHVPCSIPQNVYLEIRDLVEELVEVEGLDFHAAYERAQGEVLVLAGYAATWDVAVAQQQAQRQQGA